MIGRSVSQKNILLPIILLSIIIIFSVLPLSRLSIILPSSSAAEKEENESLLLALSSSSSNLVRKYNGPYYDSIIPTPHHSKVDTTINNRIDNLNNNNNNNRPTITTVSLLPGSGTVTVTYPAWFFIGYFDRANNEKIISYTVRSGSWNIGDVNTNDNSILWTHIGDTSGFGNLLDGRHRLWLGKFDIWRNDEFLMYSSSDGDWWIATIDFGNISPSETDYRLFWQKITNTRGFENLADGLHQVLIGDLNGDSRAEIIAYSFGSAKWFLVSFSSGGSSMSLNELFGRIVTP